MSLFEYISAHPFWTLIYLTEILFVLTVCVLNFTSKEWRGQKNSLKDFVQNLSDISKLQIKTGTNVETKDQRHHNRPE